ncbi:undecaprenyl/decaprenyl-phosphate alpha-N-acetylglucosaminyl 1-phosphate transferase [Pendulispora brunnea]|uniref:Undecaprenyl/decaprenyl-phosphate alpha-N-acetylglucosaminyl 1-phosphate transferase n=1 Tax=Pendulispora brunnea TaxID=2905690 RepID=A0ABZ2KGZ9_9BACT
MFSAIIAFFLATVVAALLTPIVRRLALAVGAVDDPTARRVHTRRVPRLGGMAIVLGFFVPLVVLYALDTQSARILFSQPRVVGGLVVGSLIMAGLGLCDDVIGVGAKMKLALQVTAAVLAYASGLRIDGVTLPFIGAISFGWIALPVTVLWFCGIVNALNLIDGLDGLAGGVAFFACLTNTVVAFMGHNVSIALLSVTLGGAIVGFLFYNFNPAKIFMGDSGSMFLGFALAASALLGGAGTQKTPTLIAIIAPLVALGLPIMDMLFAIARRFMMRRSIFAADRGHIHHRLLDLGLTHRRAVLVLYAISLAFTIIALGLHFGRSWQVGVALVVLTTLIFGVVRFVGAFSVTFASRRGMDPMVDKLRRAVPDVISRISAANLDDLPKTLERFCEEHGLLAVEAKAPSGARMGSFRWETPTAAARGLREAVSAKFALLDATSNPLELEFQFDSPDGAVGPQAEILLQLVADAVETRLQRVVRARAASASGRLRPVS